MPAVEDPFAPYVTAYAGTMADLAAATTGRTRRGPGGTVLAVSGAPVASLNAVIGPDLRPDVDEIVALASQEPWDVPWSIQVRGVPSRVLVDAATGLGLTRAERQPLMVRDGDAGLPDAPSVDGLVVRAVGADELGLYAGAVAAGFGAPPAVLAAHAAGAGTCYLYASDLGESVYRAVGFRTVEDLTVLTGA